WPVRRMSAYPLTAAELTDILLPLQGRKWSFRLAHQILTAGKPAAGLPGRARRYVCVRSSITRRDPDHSGEDNVRSRGQRTAEYAFLCPTFRRVLPTKGQTGWKFAGLVLPVLAIIITGWLAGWLGYLSRSLADGLVHFAYSKRHSHSITSSARAS